MTVIFDYRGLIPAGEGQGSEGGADQYENCVYAAHALCMLMLGYGDPLEPQQWREAWYRQRGAAVQHGGQNFSQAIDVINARPDLFPKAPRMWVENLGDVAGRIDQVGALGYPMVLGVHCNGSAIINTAGPFGHAAVPVYSDGSTYGLWANGFYGGIGYYSRSDLARVYGGGLTVFQRSVNQQPAALDGGQGDDTMALLTQPGRKDLVHVGTDGAVYHKWGPGLYDLIKTNESYGKPFPAGDPRSLVVLTAAYDDTGSTIDIVAVADDTSMWVCQRNVSDGSVHNPWLQVPASEAKIPALPGAKGDPGPPGQDGVAGVHTHDATTGPPKP